MKNKSELSEVLEEVREIVPREIIQLNLTRYPPEVQRNIYLLYLELVKTLNRWRKALEKYNEMWLKYERVLREKQALEKAVEVLKVQNEKLSQENQELNRRIMNQEQELTRAWLETGVMEEAQNTLLDMIKALRERLVYYGTALPVEIARDQILKSVDAIISYITEIKKKFEEKKEEKKVVGGE